MRTPNGFSLLEAVVALGLVCSASVAGLAAFSAQLRTSSRARASLEAQALAEDRLARVRLLSRDEVAHLPDSLRNGRFDRPWTRYAWTAETKQLIDRDNVFEVRVDVGWEGGSYGLNTRLYRPPRVQAAR
jgi:type II secretory pathway pseudopilin PulG